MKKLLLCTMTTALLTTGCASGLNSYQEREYRKMASSGLLIQEKNPTTGAFLGLLPGGGSFYAREAGLGIVNLLFWPLSILWDPISGYDGAKAINYDTTMYKIKNEKSKEINDLDNLLISKQISSDQYLIEKRKIEEKYNLQ